MMGPEMVDGKAATKVVSRASQLDLKVAVEMAAMMVASKVEE